MTVHTSGNSSTDTSLIRDIYCGSEVLFETCVTMKFVDDGDDDDDDDEKVIYVNRTFSEGMMVKILNCGISLV